MDQDKPAQDERREYHEVRAIFVQACVLLAPLYQPGNNSLRMSGFAMTQIVKDKFPELSATEVHIVITTIERMQRENRLHALLDKC